MNEFLKGGLIGGLRWALIGVVMYGAAIGVSSFAKTVHTTYFPVVTHAIVTDDVKTLDARIISIEFEKNYECKYIEVQTYIGSRDGRKAAVPNKFAESTGSRAEGVYIIEDWEILTNEPLDNIHADVLHECAPGYIVRTPFVN